MNISSAFLLKTFLDYIHGEETIQFITNQKLLRWWLKEEEEERASGEWREMRKEYGEGRGIFMGGKRTKVK